jgi:precorrin-3B methylase
VLVLYNPASRTRREPWRGAVAALQRHRPAQTPVASVRRAYRQGQEVELSEVGRMGDLAVDMETVVVVGSKQTRLNGGWMYTLREARDG